MGRMVKRLSQLEIDEVSLVDRPANQHGLVAIAKNYQEDDMPNLFDAEGNVVDEDELQQGDLVYDEAGNEYAYTESDPDEYDDEEDYVEEGELVGKALVPGGRFGRAGQYARYAEAQGRRGVKRAGRRLATEAEYLAQTDRGQKLIRQRGRYGAGAGAVAGLGVGGYAGHKVGKSFGQEVLEELSKSLNDDERDTVVSKALDQALGAVEEIAKRNDQLEDIVAALLEDREEQDFYEIAKGYEVPVEPTELAGVLHRAAQNLPPQDLEVLDRVLTGASEITKGYFDVVGYGGLGGTGSDVMDQVAALADQAVSKGADLGLTREQAIAAIFETNPAAYDEYLAENSY